VEFVETAKYRLLNFPFVRMVYLPVLSRSGARDRGPTSWRYESAHMRGSRVILITWNPLCCNNRRWERPASVPASHTRLYFRVLIVDRTRTDPPAGSR
jgi:hypothetical protein